MREKMKKKIAVLASLCLVACYLITINSKLTEAASECFFNTYHVPKPSKGAIRYMKKSLLLADAKQIVGDICKSVFYPF